MRITDPFSPTRVDEILQQIEIGTDLTREQCEQVQELICEYTDVFALSLSEVRVVDWYRPISKTAPLYLPKTNHRGTERLVLWYP